MTSAPVVSLTDELLAEIELAATEAKGWFLPDYFQEVSEGYPPEEWDWMVGRIDEDGNLFPVLTVNTMQYDSDDAEKLAKFYALVNRDNALAMATELRRLRVENEALTLKAGYASNNHMASLMLVADIRAAAGDPNGKLMQSELMAHIEALRVDAGRYRFVRKLENDCFMLNTLQRVSDRELDTAIDTAMQSSTEGK
jgi:uncharacterized protein YfkK (UPF0435 family)